MGGSVLRDRRLGRRLEGSVGLTIRRRKGSEIGRIRTDLAWTRDGLRIDATAAPQKGGRLTVNGTLPWRLTLAPTDYHRGDRNGARIGRHAGARGAGRQLRPGTVRAAAPAGDPRGNLRGRLVADARVSGTPDAPRANGTMQGTGVGLTLPTMDVSLTGEASSSGEWRAMSSASIGFA